MIGAWDYYPSASELAEDAYYDSLHYAEVESFESHYADEIDGRAEYLADVTSTEETPVLRNAPGQLRLNFGVAY